MVPPRGVDKLQALGDAFSYGGPPVELYLHELYFQRTVYLWARRRERQQETLVKLCN